MKGRPTLTAVLVTLAFTACGKSEPRDPLEAAMQAGKEAAAEQETKQAKTHPGDSNPLRQKLSDLEIRELFFGPEQIEGDWMAWIPCSQAHSNLPVLPADKIYLKRCHALKTHLIAKARAAGFSNVNADHVLDPSLTGAQQP